MCWPLGPAAHPQHPQHPQHPLSPSLRVSIAARARLPRGRGSCSRAVRGPATLRTPRGQGLAADGAFPDSGARLGTFPDASLRFGFGRGSIVQR